MIFKDLLTAILITIGVIGVCIAGSLLFFYFRT